MNDAEGDAAGEMAVTLFSNDIYRARTAMIGGCRDSASGVFVRHQVNLSSGGHITDMDVEEFLSRAGSGPEYAALGCLV